MDPVTRCLHCGKRMVPTPSYSGRTEVRVLRQAGPDGDTGAKGMGG